MIVFKKEKKVVKLCSSHADKVLECVEAAASALRHCARGEKAEAERYHDTVGRLETEADQLRREIADALFEGAYLPQIREDLFRLVQRVDHVANKAEDAWEFFVTQNPAIPEEFSVEFVELIDSTVQIVESLHHALRAYFKPKGKLEGIREQVEDVFRAESLIDQIEWDLTHRIFQSEYDLALKMHLQQALSVVCKISDCVEDVADEVDIVSMKSVV